MLKGLNSRNHPRAIFPPDSPAFRKYGQVLPPYDFSDMFPLAMAGVDLSGPSYIRDVPGLHLCASFPFLQDSLFGEAKIQAGLCFGTNEKMNGMEYHKSSEGIIAVTDIVLILGDIRDIKDNSWDSSLAECFFIPRGTAVELYGGTLHLSPCRVSSQPFCSIILLPEGTNAPLLARGEKEDPLLFMNNKWLLCHRESPAAAQGAFVGISGGNIQIKTL